MSKYADARFGSAWAWFPLGTRYLNRNALTPDAREVPFDEWLAWHHDYVMGRKTEHSGMKSSGDVTAFLRSIHSTLAD